MSRNKIQRAMARKVMKRAVGPWEELDLSVRPSPCWMTRAWRNNRYVVMEETGVDMDTGVRATCVMVQRHDDQPIPRHWWEMQQIKNQLYGPEVVAVEYYPAESRLTNDANIYWFWLFPEGGLPLPVIRSRAKGRPDDR